MKQLITFLATAIVCTVAQAQSDSTLLNKDTIRIGSIIIIKNGKREKEKTVDITMGKKNSKKKNANVSTNWWILDFGFSNYTDKTNYANAGSYLINRPGYP
ncbi:MAG: hypothetical protein WCG67_05800, partial [Ferruginibacter sp.]